MAIIFKGFKETLLRLGPLVLLIYVCISEFHTQFYYWSIFSFNLQFIIIYYWILRDPSILGYGFVFLCGRVSFVFVYVYSWFLLLSYWLEVRTGAKFWARGDARVQVRL